MGLFGGNSIIGLDLGSHSIKAVQMLPAKGGWQVSNAGSVPTPRGAIVDGMVADAKLLAPALRYLFTQGGMRGSAVIIAVNFTAAVVVRRMALGVMKPEVLRKQLQTQPDQFGFPGGKDQVCDFDVLGLVNAGGNDQMDTILVSAPKAPVDSRVGALRAAGLDALAVDVDPLALMRSLVECKPGMLARTGGTAIVDMGAAHTDVTVVRGASYVFTRNIPFGGEGFTGVVLQTLQCEPGEAEAIKAEIDLRWILDGAGDQEESPAYKATVAVKSVLDDLLKEIRNSILYYHAQLPEEDTEGMVDTIVLTGGTARLGGLAEYMQVSFNCQVERADFTRDFAFKVPATGGGVGTDDDPIYALAMGLAVKEPLDRQRAAVKAAVGKKAKVRKPKKGAPAPDAGPEGGAGQAAEPAQAAKGT